MSMVISRHSPIISWSKQSANFQSFTELDRGGIQNNSKDVYKRQNCMRPLINKKLKLMSELTEHTLANEIEAPHEILRK